MSITFKVQESGHCLSCNRVPGQNDHLKCYICKEVYHILCPNATADQKVASKTTVTGFLSPSTKLNFKFFCDNCLTKFEIDQSSSEKDRLNVLEKKFQNIETKLDNIVTKLNEPSTSSVNQWENTTRTNEMKKNLIVVKKTSEETFSDTKRIIEDIVVKNNIAMKNAFKSKKGDMVLVCDTPVDSDKLQSLVQTADQDLDCHRLFPKMKSISIVGMPEECTTEEFTTQLRNQNSRIKNLVDISNFSDHFKCRKVKSLKNNEAKFQAFCSVSDTLYTVLQNLNNKVMLGLTCCKVYLQNNVPRCFNCQEYGHISKVCSKSTRCGKCAAEHKTNDCTSSNKVCFNCQVNKQSDINHYSFDNRCPTMLKVNKSSESSNNLNLNL